MTDTSLVFVAAQTTTGTDKEIVDLAIVANDGTTLFHTSFNPTDPEKLPDGYTRGDVAPSPRFRGRALQILGYLTKPIVAGHNTQLSMKYVVRFLRKSFQEDGYDSEDITKMMARIDMLYIDAITLAWEQLPDLEDRTLEDICFYLRVPYKANHSALEDARAARTVSKMLIRATAWKRWWWKWKAPK